MDLQDLKKELKKNKDLKHELETYDLAHEISHMLLEARILKGITQKKLAEMINTKQSGIARAERGVSLPSLSFLEKIAQALHTQLIVRFAFMDDKAISINGHSQNTLQPKPYTVINQNPDAYTPSFVYSTIRTEPTSANDLGGTYYA